MNDGRTVSYTAGTVSCTMDGEIRIENHIDSKFDRRNSIDSERTDSYDIYADLGAYCGINRFFEYKDTMIAEPKIVVVEDMPRVLCNLGRIKGVPERTFKDANDMLAEAFVKGYRDGCHIHPCGNSFTTKDDVPWDLVSERQRTKIANLMAYIKGIAYDVGRETGRRTGVHVSDKTEDASIIPVKMRTKRPCCEKGDKDLTFLDDGTLGIECYEGSTGTLQYCPYCGKKIEIEENIGHVRAEDDDYESGFEGDV